MPFDGTHLNDAAEAIIVLDMMKAMFRGGKRWVRRHCEYHKRRCMLRALDEAVRTSGLSDELATFYLVRAIDPKVAKEDSLFWRNAIAEFNDATAWNYGDIRKILKLARYYADTGCAFDLSSDEIRF
jgi:hypothetical protein